MATITKVYQGATEVDRIYTGAQQTFDKTTQAMYVGAADGGGGSPWTPNDGGAQRWYKAESANITKTGVEDKFSHWNDLSPAANTLINNASASQAWFVDASGGVQILDQAKYLGPTTSLTADSVIAVIMYKTGVETTFSNYHNIFRVDGTKRVMGQISANTLSTINTSTNQSFINGASSSTNVVLPMPKSIQRIAFASITGAFNILHEPAASVSFVGSCWEYIIMPVGADAATIAKFEGYLAWEHGLVASLPPGHNHKSAAPTV